MVPDLMTRVSRSPLVAKGLFEMAALFGNGIPKASWRHRRAGYCPGKRMPFLLWYGQVADATVRLFGKDD